jgi:hypothetical protein
MLRERPARTVDSDCEEGRKMAMMVVMSVNGAVRGGDEGSVTGDATSHKQLVLITI